MLFASKVTLLMHWSVWSRTVSCQDNWMSHLDWVKQSFASLEPLGSWVLQTQSSHDFRWHTSCISTHLVTLDMRLWVTVVSCQPTATHSVMKLFVVIKTCSGSSTKCVILKFLQPRLDLLFFPKLHGATSQKPKLLYYKILSDATKCQPLLWHMVWCKGIIFLLNIRWWTQVRGAFWNCLVKLQVWSHLADALCSTLKGNCYPIMLLQLFNL